MIAPKSAKEVRRKAQAFEHLLARRVRLEKLSREALSLKLTELADKEAYRETRAKQLEEAQDTLERYRQRLDELLSGARVFIDELRMSRAHIIDLSDHVSTCLQQFHQADADVKQCENDISFMRRQLAALCAKIGLFENYLTFLKSSQQQIEDDAVDDETEERTQTLVHRGGGI